MKRIYILPAAAAVLLCTACVQSSVPGAMVNGGVKVQAKAEVIAEQPAKPVSRLVPAEILTEEQKEKIAAAAALEKEQSELPKKPLDTFALDEMVKQNHNVYAVLLESIDGTELYSYQEDLLVSGASLIKLPYVYYCCTQIAEGKFDLTDTMTYTANFWQGGSGVVCGSKLGTKYTIAQLMEYTLRYSDNTAYYMLVSKFGADGFNRMVKEWGYPQIAISVYDRFPCITASFMRTAMRKMYWGRKSGECWKVAWDALVNSERSFAREEIGGSDDVAAKYGSWDEQYHETVLVDGEKPYLLVILSHTVNYNPDEQTVKDVAAAAQAVAEQYNRGDRYVPREEPAAQGAEPIN